MTDKEAPVTKDQPIEAGDLDIIPAALSDADKSEAEIWNELRAAEKAPAGAKEEQERAQAAEELEKAQAAPDSTPEAKADTKAEEAKPDPRANALAELKANATEEQKAALADLEHRAKSEAGRHKAHQRRLDELRRDLQPSQTPDKLKAARESLRSAEEEYPEVAKPVASALDAVTETLMTEKEGRRKAAETDLSEIVKEEAAKVVAAHPDVDAFLKQHGGNAFAAWVDDQPRRIRETFVRNGNAIVDGEGAAEIIAAYKAFVGWQPAAAPADAAPPQKPDTQSLADRRERQLAGSNSPRVSGGRPIVSGPPPETASTEEHWKYWRSIDAAKERARA